MALGVHDGFPYYIEKTKTQNLNSLFQDTNNYITLASLSEEQSLYAYAPGKWTLKQILGHITDHERIMTYRALRISRKDTTLLPGYDQNLFVENAPFMQLSWKQLLQDYQLVRQATISLISTFRPEQFLLTGQAWKFTLTVEDFLRATIGHEMHHMEVLKEKYLPEVCRPTQQPL